MTSAAPARPSIDLNADLGEGYGRWTCADDDALLHIVTSANVACGFHAGDPAIMRATCERAAALGVRVGAHVGYPDLAGFGRREIGLGAHEVGDQVAYQIGALQAVAATTGCRVSHVKPHGALYHRATNDDACAEAIAKTVALVDRALIVLAPPHGALTRAAERHGLATVSEGFVDRAYRPDGSLVPRERSGSVLTAAGALAQALAIARDRRAITADGDPVAVAARSLCLHGDTPGAVDLARAVRAGLVDAGFDVRAFA